MEETTTTTTSTRNRKIRTLKRHSAANSTSLKNRHHHIRRQKKTAAAAAAAVEEAEAETKNAETKPITPAAILNIDLHEDFELMHSLSNITLTLPFSLPECLIGKLIWLFQNETLVGSAIFETPSVQTSIQVFDEGVILNLVLVDEDYWIEWLQSHPEELKNKELFRPAATSMYTSSDVNCLVYNVISQHCFLHEWTSSSANVNADTKNPDVDTLSAIVDTMVPVAGTGGQLLIFH